MFLVTCDVSAAAVLEDEPNNAKRRAPQRVGVLTPGGFLVHSPETDQRVEFVGARLKDHLSWGKLHGVAQRATGGAKAALHAA